MIKKLITNNQYFLLKILLLTILFSLIHYAMGYSPRLNYTAGIIALLIVISPLRIIYCGFIIIFTIIAALYFPARFLYGAPSLTIATSVTYTNLHEAIEFITNIPYYLYIGSLFILLFGFSVQNSSLIAPKNKGLGFYYLSAVSFLWSNKGL